jgi:hypothetical protein
MNFAHIEHFSAISFMVCNSMNLKRTTQYWFQYKEDQQRNGKASKQDPMNHSVNSPLQPEKKWVGETGYLEEVEDTEACNKIHT